MLESPYFECKRMKKKTLQNASTYKILYYIGVIEIQMF